MPNVAAYDDDADVDSADDDDDIYGNEIAL